MEHEQQQQQSSKAMTEAPQTTPSREGTPTPPPAIPILAAEQTAIANANPAEATIQPEQSPENTANTEGNTGETASTEVTGPEPEKSKKVLFSAISDSEEETDEEEEEDSEEE